PGDSPVRTSAGAADDVHVVIERQIVETGGQLAQRHVVSAFDVSCLPLVVLTDVDDGSTFGDVIDGHGCFSIHGPSVGTHLRSMPPCRGSRRETAQPHRPWPPPPGDKRPPVSSKGAVASPIAV